jgi:hypothetical protein
VELRKSFPRVIGEFGLSISHRALERIWREMACGKNARRNISANKTSCAAKPSGLYFSKAAQIPRI